MSVRVMSLVWSLDLPDSQKIVLLALADCANDEGHCWPSMASLTAKCSKSERTIQGVIKDLVAGGHLTRDENPGKGCNYYVHPRSNCAPIAPAVVAPRKGCPPQGTTQTPAAAADKPSRTIIRKEAKASSLSAAPAKPDQFPRPDWADPQVWSDWMDVRKAKHGRNTPTAHAGFLADIAKLTNDEWPPGRLLAYAVTKSWAGIYEPKEGYPTSGRPSGHPNALAGLRGSRPNPALDLVIEAERELAAEAQRENQGADWTAWPALPSR